MNQIVQQCLDAHNEYRRKHGAPPMVINNSLMRMAQNWAQNNANRCRMAHSTGRGSIGENLYCGSASLTSGRKPVQSWYNEIKDYNYNRPGFSYGTGHFTQVVWKASTQLGVGWAKGRNGWTYFCCNYSPSGNYQGKFRANVLPLGTRPPVSASNSSRSYASVYCETNVNLTGAAPSDEPEEYNEAEEEALETEAEEAEVEEEGEEDIGEASRPERDTGDAEEEEAEEDPEPEVEEETEEALEPEKEEEAEEAPADEEEAEEAPADEEEAPVDEEEAPADEEEAEEAPADEEEAEEAPADEEEAEEAPADEEEVGEDDAVEEEEDE